MDPASQFLNYDNIRQKSEENRTPRKRTGSSVRLSPRKLFENFKTKKPLMEENPDISRDLNKSKTVSGWRPPLKAVLNATMYNEPSTSYSNHDSFPYENPKCYLQDPGSFLKEKCNFPDFNQNFSKQSDDEMSTGCSDDTVLCEEYELENVSNPNADTQWSHDISLSDSFSEDMSNKNIMLTECIANNENANNVLEPLIEKRELSLINDFCQTNNNQNLHITPDSKEIGCFQDQNNPSVDFSYNMVNIPCKGNIEHWEKENSGSKVDNMVCSEQNEDSSQSLTELRESTKQFIMNESQADFVSDSQTETNQEFNNNQSCTVEQNKDEIKDTAVGEVDEIFYDNNQKKSSCKALKDCTEAIQSCSSLIVESKFKNQTLKSLINEISKLNEALTLVIKNIKEGRLEQENPSK